MRYFRAQLPENYRLRYSVSLLSSERDQVVPLRTNHQNATLNLNIFYFKRERSRPKCVGSQEINLFAQVALNPYGSSSASRLTGYSFRDLIWNSNLGVGFPLRCFQRLSQRNVATRRYSWRYNRHTRDSSREVLSYCPQLSSKFRRFYRIESELSPYYRLM